MKEFKLTKADTVALWHAVDDMSAMCRAACALERITESEINFHRERLITAKRALRKVNAIRKAQRSQADKPEVK